MVFIILPIVVNIISSHIIRRDSVYRRQYLKTFGYGNGTNYPKMLGKFQDFSHLNLAEVMELPRCAFKDQSYTPLRNISEDQDFLQFTILQYPRSSLLSRSEIDTIAREVANSWEYSGLKIKSSRNEDADIAIIFCDFADCFDDEQDELFDLTGVTLNRPGGGWEILINSKQAWAGETNLARISYGTLDLQMQLKQVKDFQIVLVRLSQFYQVLLHQFGHALGLPHSDNPVSIMSPFYLEWVANVEPSPEDFASLAKLLGIKPRLPRRQRTHWIYH